MLLSLVVLSLMVTSSALAYTQNISATGYGLTNAGDPDSNWLIGNYPGHNGDSAQLLTSSGVNFGSTWLSNGPNSNWIGVTAANSGNSDQLYSFNYTFDLSAFDVSTVSLSGQWAIDDVGILTVNGHGISSLGEGNYVSLHSFSLAAGSGFLNTGLNTLSIILTSNDNEFEGVRLEGTITGDTNDNPVPEPCTILLLGSGLAGLAGFRRRFKRS